MARKKEFDPEKALDKAMHIFWLKGYEATSLDDLCAAMGIKRGSLYPTFGNKHALFMQSLDRYINMMYRSSDLGAEPRSPLQVIAEMFQDGVDQAVNDPQHRGCFLTNTISELAATDPEVAKFTKDQAVAFEKHLYSLLVQAEANGEVSSNHDLHAKAHFLVTAFYGLRVTGKFNQDRQTLEKIVEETMSVLS